jgi:hypothetical protein
MTKVTGKGRKQKAESRSGSRVWLPVSVFCLTEIVWHATPGAQDLFCLLLSAFCLLLSAFQNLSLTPAETKTFGTVSPRALQPIEKSSCVFVPMIHAAPVSRRSEALPLFCSGD